MGIELPPSFQAMTDRAKAHAILDRLPDDRVDAALAALESVAGRDPSLEPPLDISADAIAERLEHEPATREEFEATYGAVKPSDGEG